MKYLSLFSGIEACSVAWHDFGTPVAFSEIEPFPCAVLAHHYPKVPNLGDVTKITEQQIKSLGPIDLVVFGSPCQDLSVAGKRKGLINADGDVTRSGLFFTAINIVHWARKHCGLRFALWENVPGAFSSNKGADFAEVVKHMAGFDELDIPANGWGSEGCALGSQLVEWAVLDAQWFGVAQRRKRVFAVADFGDWASRAPILLERESLRGDTPPSRKAGKDVAGTFKACARSGGWSNSADHTAAGYMQPVYGDRPGRPYLIGFEVGPTTARFTDVAPTMDCRAKNGPIQNQLGVGVFSAGFSAGNSSGSRGIGYTEEGTPPLRSGASGTNQVPTIICYGGNNTAGNINVATAINTKHRCDFESETFVTYALAGNTIGRKPENGGNHIGYDDSGAAYTLTKTDVHAVAFAQNTRDEVRYINDDGKIAGALAAQPGMKQTTYLHTQAQVRRLTPVECARLQGFPDNYLDIQFRNKPAADGNKYKALGNSMAVPVMRYIGQRIKAVLDEPFNIDDLI